MIEQIICADALDGLAQLENGSIDMCVTSPPYYGLRDYGVYGQIGLEKTPEAYIKRLVAVFREVRRVLRDDGTLWVNIADTYCSTAPGTYTTPLHIKGLKKDTAQARARFRPKNPEGMKPKDLIGIPWMLAFALRADGWWLRQDIIWAKPNPMPESVKDRCTKSHEYIFLLSKSARYYYDAEAIAEPVADSTTKRMEQNIEAQAGSNRIPGKANGPMKAVAPRYGGDKYTKDPNSFYRTKSGNLYDYKTRRNKRSVWTVTTKPFKEAHYAVFPPDLIRPCILAGSRKGGIVLDPFFGSGATGLVAMQEQRGYIGIELNPDYVDLARRRLDSAVIQYNMWA